MTKTTPAVLKLQEEIEKIDEGILSQLHQRFKLVQKINRNKKLAARTIAYFPGHEAQVVRSLLKRGEGISASVLVRIWREILSTGAQLHRSFSIAVYTKERPHEMMDIAKNHFGVNGRYTACLSVSQAIRKINMHEAGVAVLPLFEHSEESWWTVLSSPEYSNLSIIAKLPFAKPSDLLKSNEAFVVGTAFPEPTGNDCSLFAVEMSGPTSMTSLKALLEDSGLKVLSILPALNLSRVYLFAVELEGYITLDDDRMVLFHARNKTNIHLVRRIGGYAVQETLVGEGDAK